MPGKEYGFQIFQDLIKWILKFMMREVRIGAMQKLKFIFQSINNQQEKIRNRNQKNFTTQCSQCILVAIPHTWDTTIKTPTNILKNIKSLGCVILFNNHRSMFNKLFIACNFPCTQS